MSRGKAIWLAVLTAWPLIYLVIFMGFMFFTMMSTIGAGNSRAPLPPAFAIILPLHFLTIFSIFALMVVYIVHLFKTERVTPQMKPFWAIVLFMGNMIAMPIYWYLYIWREPDAPEPTAPPAKP